MFLMLLTDLGFLTIPVTIARVTLEAGDMSHCQRQDDADPKEFHALRMLSDIDLGVEPFLNFTKEFVKFCSCLQPRKNEIGRAHV